MPADNGVEPVICGHLVSTRSKYVREGSWVNVIASRYDGVTAGDVGEWVRRRRSAEIDIDGIDEISIVINIPDCLGDPPAFLIGKITTALHIVEIALGRDATILTGCVVGVPFSGAPIVPLKKIGDPRPATRR